MCMTHARHVLFVAAFALAAPAYAQDGDPAAGQKVFRKCAACHTAEADGPNRVGPNLHGVVGRAAGKVEGFKYSEAMVKAGEEGYVWTPENLSAYLEHPKETIPGNKMTFAGLKKPEERADVIAYLESMSGDGGS